MPIINHSKPDLVVFSHLRWNFVHQRPHHLMTRFSQQRRVLFVEEPNIEENKPKPVLQKISKQLWVLTISAPRIVSTKFLSGISDSLRRMNFKLPIFWLYSPSFLRCALKFRHSLLVYDCMDELSAFKNAPPHLRDQEFELLTRADVVFTGGKSLYESKSKYHSSVHCFPSSVETEHFTKASNQELSVPKDLITIPRPIVGFYGVLDERLDLNLLNKLAVMMPDISFVFIGPVAKIDPRSLPVQRNIYYLGLKDYIQLPNYLQEFDLAFMPFALNKSTQYISPTKTLEFMAAHKLIVSTPIKDVARTYSEIVKIASTAKEMELAIRMGLKESDYQRRNRINLENQVLAETSWERTAFEMDKLISQMVELKTSIEIPAVNGKYQWELSNAS